MPPFLSIADQCRRQADWCERLGSPLYGHLLSRCADDYEAGGDIRDLLQSHEKDDEASVLPLRLMRAVHQRILEGQLADLAKFYPSVGGIVELNGAWVTFRRAVKEHNQSLGTLIEKPLQTNEVGRSGSLLGGFGVIAEQTRLPLRLLEVGASAGLNLRWDQYRYEWRGGTWGETASPVRLENIFIDGAPFLPSTIKVVERVGCDLCPIDINSNAGILTLLSSTWADQLDRIRRLEAAIEIGRAIPCVIEKANGADWIEARLRNTLSGAVTVVFHSALWPYLSESEQRRISAAIEEAGKRASQRAPVAWLRMEAVDKRFEIRLRIYPGFQEQIIATSSAHAPSVRWLLKSTITKEIE